MLRKIIGSFLLAFHNIRSHFFHTLLSVLGIVIGVAALVSILSLIDGMEKYAREQIALTTSLKAINIKSDVHKRVNDIRIRKDTFAILSYTDIDELKLSHPATTYFYSTLVDEVQVGNHNIGTTIIAMGEVAIPANERLILGELYSREDLIHQNQKAIINKAFAKLLVKDSSFSQLLGKRITFQKFNLEIVGIVDNPKSNSPRLVMPISLLSMDELRTYLPELLVEAENVEDVASLKAEIIAFLKSKFSTYQEDFSVFTNDIRVQQATQGFLLFRVIMGLIVGISVLVGGIGVMNVLLISVTERTVEIGVRKAVGASRRDIILQFLSESITVSAFGSLLGTILGILGTMALIPIIKAITKIPFQAAYTTNTVIVISIIALGVGIIFGTYPAIRASKLDPVEAIRRE